MCERQILVMMRTMVDVSTSQSVASVGFILWCVWTAVRLWRERVGFKPNWTMESGLSSFGRDSDNGACD